MELPDYEKTRAILIATEDQQVLRLVRVMDPVFRRSRFRPDARSAENEGDVAATVREFFPAPFARQFRIWAQDLGGELREAIAGWTALDRSDPQRSERERRVRLRFRSAALQIESCWKQIVHFLPFILIAALRRVDDSVLRSDVAKEVGRALRNYNAFYVQYSLERQREAVQYQLLVSLLKLFRQLAQHRVLGEDFLFAPLMGGEHPSFSDVVPERFDAGMLFLQEVRNRLTHGGLVDRLPPDALGPVNDLVSWVFIDVVGVLARPCRVFGLTFITASKVGPQDVTVQALDYSGISGPPEVAYRVSKEWQLEEYALLPYRIYLVARDRELDPAAAPLLAPRDYLDLTPFLIVDRLRSRASSEDSLVAERQQLIFALQQYLEPMRQLLFSDLGGAGDRLRPSDSRDAEADSLLRQMGDFRNRYRDLVEQVALRDQRTLSTRQVGSALGRVSRDHLATLIDIDRYDEAGHVADDRQASGLKAAYVDELFVDPQEATTVDAFFSSGKRLLLLVGDSGSGKSNLLVHRYLARLRSGEPAVFLSGRRFETAAFGSGLVSKVLGRVSDTWQSLENLGAFLEENDETLAIFVDALNEFSGPGGPRSLIESLLADVGTDALRRCRVIGSVRSETWLQYCALVGRDRPLDPSLSFTNDGSPVRVASFDDLGLRDRLYTAYQRFYSLLPERFPALSGHVQALVTRPFMLAMISEAYSNRASEPGEPKRRIPADLDYFAIFGRLTERKAQDAQILVPPENVAQREAMPEAIDDLCALMAEMIFERLMSRDQQRPGAAARDALPIDAVNKRAELEPFVQNRNSISVLEAVLQVGLLERIAVPQRNREGRLVPSAAFKFFHDQYTQYCLAAAYQRGILGWLDRERLSDAAALEAVVRTMGEVVGRAVNTPILSGALDHWLRKNIANFHDDRIEPVMPLFDQLVAQGSPALRHQAVSLLTNLVVRDVLPARELYAAAFTVGSPVLRLALVDGFIAFWSQLPASALTAFLDACDPRRDLDVIDRLGDVFALHVATEPEAVAAYLDQAILPLSLSSITEPARLRRQSRFAMQFAIFATFSSFDQPPAIQAVRDFVRSKYRSLLEVVDPSASGSVVGRLARRTVRQLLFKLFDGFGVAQWNKFIAAMEPSGNDKFFVEYEGVVQRELLAEFLPYVVALHNGEHATLSLAEGSPFRELTLRMLDFKPASIIGYNATIALPSVLVHQDWAVTERFVMELIARGTPSAQFHGQLLLSNIAFSDPALAQPCLELWADRIIPALLAQGAECDWSMSYCVASLDVDTLWPTFARLLGVFFQHFEARADAQACAEFGDHLYKVCFCSDIRLGRHLIALQLRDPARFLGPLWRVCTLKVFAAMLTRNPEALHSVLLAEGADEALAREALAYGSAEVVKQSRLFPFQVDVNRCVAWMFMAEPKLRHAIVKHFIGSLAAGTSVADFARGVRHTMVTVLTFFFGDHPENLPAGSLSVEEIAQSVSAARGGTPMFGRVSVRNAD